MKKIKNVQEDTPRQHSQHSGWRPSGKRRLKVAALVSATLAAALCLVWLIAPEYKPPRADEPLPLSNSDAGGMVSPAEDGVGKDNAGTSALPEEELEGQVAETATTPVGEEVPESTAAVAVVQEDGEYAEVVRENASTIADNRADPDSQDSSSEIEWPLPKKSRFSGEVIDYRVVELPPLEKGGKPGELREWLIEPNEGYTAHVEEEYRPNDEGELQVVDANEYVANQVLLTLDGETSFEDFKEKLESQGAIVKAPLMELEKGAKIVAVMVSDVSLDSVENLRAAVAGVNPKLEVDNDYFRTIDRVPNDVRYSSQWGLAKIQAPDAWNIRTDASSVVVAVVDSGVYYNHSDLNENMWRNPQTGRYSGVTGDLYGMRVFAGVRSGNPSDGDGHGTHCAGIIGAVGNNSLGVSGVAWKTKIMAVRVTDDEWNTTDTDIVTGMDYARQMGADILSCSWGGTGYSSSISEAFRSMRSAGIICVCAAGNGGNDHIGDDNDTIPHYPSSLTYDNIVAVAASTSSDTLTSFSNYGSQSVDIAAPGASILSTINSGSYDSWDGTSMATPFVAGALALLKAHYPSYTYLQLIQKLYADGDTVSALSGKVSTGKRLNVYKPLSSPQLVSPVPTASHGTYSDRVVVSWPSVSGATYYRVYRSTSSSGAKTALGSWQTGVSYTDSSVTVGTTYYYWVCAATSSSGANQSAYGTYATGYAQASSGDAYDPGDDTPSGGTTITPTTSRSTHSGHTLSATDKYDFFKISMSADTTYTFETTGTMDTYGELFNAASTNTSNRVAYNDDGGTNANFRIQYTPTASGTYYLRVRAFSVGNPGSYALAYQRSSARDNWDPGDDTPSGGTLLTPTTTVQTHGIHSLSSDDRYDFFRISMTAGRKYTFESTGSYDMYGELFNSTSTNASYRVAYDDDSGDSANFKLEYTPTTSQTYYLRVRRYSVGSDGSYSLKYSYSPPPAVESDIVFKQHSTWPTAPFFTTASDSMDPQNSFTTNEVVWVRYLWGEANWSAVNGPITNSIHVYNSSGAKVILIATEYTSGIVANNSMQGRWHFDVSRLSPGAYTAIMHLNEDHFGNHGAQEMTYTNNIVSLPFTIVNPQKTLSSISISGNAAIPSKGTADYRCTGTYSDGSTADVSPTWSITSGSAYASVSSSGSPGRVTSGDTTVDRTITLQAAFGGKTATKAITIRGTGPGPIPDPPPPFDDPVSYPNVPMIVEGVVYINNVLAAGGDQIAAFSGNEVRGVARIVANGRVTMGVNLAESGERISFKVWDASEGDNGTIYNCLQTLAGTSDPQGTPSSPIRFDAASSDPFGQVTPEPLVPPTIIEASVSVDGAVASAGDILAVFSGNAIVGKAPITYLNQNGQESATCRPVMFFSGRKTLSFRLWDADREEVLEASATLTVSAGDVTGSVASPYAITFTSVNDDVPCAVSLNSGWNLVSFSVLPDSPTPANVFAQVASSVQYVSDVSGNLWGPAIGNSGLNTMRIGAGYWVRSSANNVTWNVEGHGNADTDISLVSGWNLIGYTLPRAGQVANVLRTAIASGKVQYITDQSGNVYPGGALSSMRPGVGYWVRSTSAYTLRFDRDGMESAASALSILAAGSEHPFAAPAVRMGVPTVFQNMSVTLFGKTAGYGDYLAVFDRSTDEIVSVQPINSEDGTLTFTIMGLRANDRFYFKVWNRASGLDSPEIFTSASSNDLTISNPDNPVVGYRVAITGTAPSFTVRYDLAGKGTRTGGGALTQNVAFGGNAVDPTVSANSGWQFVDWDYSKRTDIRGPMTITALYEAVSGDAGETSTTCLFEATGGSKTASLTLPGTALSFSGMNATSSASWCSATVGITGRTLYFYVTAQANSSATSRTATLTKVVSGVTYTVNVTQNGTGGLPGGTSDLAFYTPSGWPASAFVTSSASSMTPQTTFAVGSSVFLSFAYVNNGAVNAGAHTVTVALADSSDEIQWSEDFDIASCSTTDVLTLEGYGLGTFGATGTYTVYVILDTNDDLDQSNTDNDVAAVSFTVHGSTPPRSLNDAVDNSTFTITTGGSAGWFSQSTESYDGVDAARSGAVSHGQQSWMAASGVSGNGIVSFRWKVSSEAGYDWIKFYIDGEYIFGRAGTGDDWRYEAFSVGPGAHEFAWVYEKDNSRSSGQDCAWVDQVKWTPNSPLSPVYRFYSPNYRGHFFTMDLDEMAELINTNPNWRYEGVAYFAYPEPASGLKPLYRFYSKSYRGHFYTMDEEEMWTVRMTNPNWKYEGIAYYIKPSTGTGATPIYRFWSKGYRHHFYTASYDEMMNLRRTNPNWAYESIAFYAWMTPDVLATQALSAAPGAAGAEVAEETVTTGGTGKTGNSGSAGKAGLSASPDLSGNTDDGMCEAAAPWTLMLRNPCPGRVLAVPGVNDLGDITVETGDETSACLAILATAGKTDAATAAAELRLMLPEGLFTAQLWRDTGMLDEQDVEGCFDFALSDSGEWHRLTVFDADGKEVFAIWLRAEK